MTLDLAPQNRGGNGRFLPGNRANPGGRPRSLSSLILERTNDGAELVDFALGVLRTSRSTRFRFEALHWLADHGWGKPVQAHEVSTDAPLAAGAVVIVLPENHRGDRNTE